MGAGSAIQAVNEKLMQQSSGLIPPCSFDHLGISSEFYGNGLLL